MKTFLLSLFIFTGMVLFAQTELDSVSVTSGGIADDSEIDKNDIESYLNRKKLRFNLEFGTSFGGNKYGSYFGTYVAPHFSYPVSKRFTLSVGGYFTGISPVGQGENPMAFGYPYSTFTTRSFLYVQGAYHLTDNLTVTGAAYKEINLFNPTPSAFMGNHYDSHGFIMGVDYKISDNVFIRGQVEVSNGASPYHYSPFMRPTGSRMQDPFFTPGR